MDCMATAVHCNMTGLVIILRWNQIERYQLVLKPSCWQKRAAGTDQSLAVFEFLDARLVSQRYSASSIILYMRPPTIALRITLQIVVEPFSAHCPSPDHMDGLCLGFQVMLGTPLCMYLLDVESAPQSTRKSETKLRIEPTYPTC